MSVMMKTVSLFSLGLLLSACVGAYSSHHGNRGARYNNMPYRGNYQYNNYHHQGSAYMGRPYRRF